MEQQIRHLLGQSQLCEHRARELLECSKLFFRVVLVNLLVMAQSQKLVTHLQAKQSGHV